MYKRNIIKIILGYFIIYYQSKKNSKPTYSFMLEKFSRIIAFGFGSGLFTLIPGTMGSIAAWLIFNILNLQAMNLLIFSIFCICMLILGSWACSKTQESLNTLDSSYIVFDEWLGIWICFWVLQNSHTASFSYQLLIFILFRFFDMLKPQPIKIIETKFKQHGLIGGFGIMIDDVLAAIYTILIVKIFS